MAKQVETWNTFNDYRFQTEYKKNEPTGFYSAARTWLDFFFLRFCQLVEELKQYLKPQR
jgi:hypothetical protein